MSVEKPPYTISKSASHLSLEFIEAIYTMLLAQFHVIYPVSEALRNSIIKNTKVDVYKKGEKILEHGQINRGINFVFSGLLMAYYVKDNLEKRVSWFLKEGAMAISVVSFHTQKPSYEAIVALEDTICISMTHDDLEWHYKNFLEFNVYGRVMKTPYHIQDNERVYSLIIEDATQRYNRLLETFPDIFSRISARDVASYLNIAPATLSRIRANKY